ncbi:MAG: prephenate dehydrogenase/arogenate dehydrogenase family protein [Pseudomonadota bacterium]
MSASNTSERSLLVIGLGMIGGSVLHSARKHGSAERLLGFDASDEVNQLAYEQGVVDNKPAPLEELLAQASLVVLAVPPMAFARLFTELSRLGLSNDAVMTDVASVKRPVLNACQQFAPDLLPQFLPAHPIAGSEQSGLMAAKIDLFKQKKLILTPHADVSGDTAQRVARFWGGLDCLLAELEPDLHDDLLASTSHLPHVLAYVLVDSLLLHPEIDRLFEFAAGGFQDISRTASSDPTMWHDVFFCNKEYVLTAVDLFEKRLALFKAMVVEGDSQQLFDMLSTAKQGRDKYLAKYHS